MSRARDPRDRFSEPMRRGGLPRLPFRTLANRPTASEELRGCFYGVGGALGTDEDVLYICLRNADGTHDWVQVATGAP